MAPSGDSDAGVPGREFGVEGLGPTIQDGLGRSDLNIMSITHHMDSYGSSKLVVNHG